MRYWWERRSLRVRPKTYGRRSGRTVKIAHEVLEPWVEAEMAARPKTRGDCAGQERPCVWYGCRHHLGTEVTPRGALQLLQPDREVDEYEESCALDVADRGPQTLHDVGRLLNVTRERVRQIEAKALRKLSKAGMP